MTSLEKRKTMKGLAYMRCSGGAQVDGDTWDRQGAAIRKYAEANQIDVVEWFRDEAVTGKMELENREGLSACILTAREQDIKLVLVESCDRLARDLIVAEVCIREFQKIGVTVIAAAGGVDLTAGSEQNPTAKLVRQILAAVAEFDRCVIVLKTRAARERIKANGRHPGQKNYSPDPVINKRVEGRKPYGALPGEAETLALMRSLRNGGSTFAQISDNLNGLSMPTRSGALWRFTTVAKILSR